MYQVGFMLNVFSRCKIRHKAQGLQYPKLSKIDVFAVTENTRFRVFPTRQDVANFAL